MVDLQKSIFPTPYDPENGSTHPLSSPLCIDEGDGEGTGVRLTSGRIVI
jgi:hypothetical protein